MRPHLSLHFTFPLPSSSPCASFHRLTLPAAGTGADPCSSHPDSQESGTIATLIGQNKSLPPVFQPVRIAPWRNVVGMKQVCLLAPGCPCFSSWWCGWYSCWIIYSCKCSEMSYRPMQSTEAVYAVTVAFQTSSAWFQTLSPKVRARNLI